MKKLLALSFVTLAFGCATAGRTSPAYSSDTTRQLNSDRRYAHASDGQIILGPSNINEVVVGQKDLVGNIHVDPLPRD